MKKLSKARVQKLLADFEKAATNLYWAGLNPTDTGNSFGWALVTLQVMQKLKLHFGEDGFTVCTDTENQRVYAKLKGA